MLKTYIPYPKPWLETEVNKNGLYLHGELLYCTYKITLYADRGI